VGIGEAHIIPALWAFDVSDPGSAQASLISAHERPTQPDPRQPPRTQISLDPFRPWRCTEKVGRSASLRGLLQGILEGVLKSRAQNLGIGG
jgi:hypothetical protein